MRNYAVVTLFEQMFGSIMECGVSARALKQNKAKLEFYNPRDYTNSSYNKIDDTPFGGGPGMVMQAEPLYLATQEAVNNISNKTSKSSKSSKSENKSFENKTSNKNKVRCVYFAPQGEVLTQSKLCDLASYDSLVFVCGRYEGVDQRFIDACVDEVISVGDYVLSGGELAAMTCLDGILRLLPGSIKSDSALNDSFSSNLSGLLEAPQYTKPAVWREHKVPQVLLSGNHAKIEGWHRFMSYLITDNLRPDLFKKFANNKNLTKEQKKCLQEYILAAKSKV